MLFSEPSTHQLLLQRIRRTFSHLPERYQYADTSEKQKERNENISLEKMHWKVKQMILVAIYRESMAQLVSSVCKLSAPAMHLLLKTSQRYLQMEKSLIFFKQVQQKLKHGNKNLGFQLKWRWNLWGVLFWISSSSPSWKANKNETVNKLTGLLSKCLFCFSRTILI